MLFASVVERVYMQYAPLSACTTQLFIVNADAALEINNE
jgi:hypothetical protein